MKDMIDLTLERNPSHLSQQEKWGREIIRKTLSIPIPYTAEHQIPIGPILVPKIQDPLISGLRLFQCPTGAQYKMRSILEKHKLNFLDVLVGGDGSGGISSMILRSYPSARLIFNSLLELNGVELKGTSPSPPSAIACIPKIQRRCINYKGVWKYPSDLAKPETWKYFCSLKTEHQLSIDLIILDMEVKNEPMMWSIELMVEKFVTKLLSNNGTLIFKTYLGRLLDNWTQGILQKIGVMFYEVSLNVTAFSSSHTRMDNNPNTG